MFDWFLKGSITMEALLDLQVLTTEIDPETMKKRKNLKIVLPVVTHLSVPTKKLWNVLIFKILADCKIKLNTFEK